MLCKIINATCTAILLVVIFALGGFGGRFLYYLAINKNRTADGFWKLSWFHFDVVFWIAGSISILLFAAIYLTILVVTKKTKLLCENLCLCGCCNPLCKTPRKEYYPLELKVIRKNRLSDRFESADNSEEEDLHAFSID